MLFLFRTPVQQSTYYISVSSELRCYKVVEPKSRSLLGSIYPECYNGIILRVLKIMMNNSEKLDFIVRYERKRKQKRLAYLALVLLVFGALMIFFQVMNYQDIE